MVKYKFEDLVDVKGLNSLMSSFFRLTGIPVGIIDIHNKILVQIGWQKICLEFHRKNPDSFKNCIESDHYIDSHIGEKKYTSYTCKNGLTDIAIPIVIDGEHMANLFLGQFLYGKPDRSFFENQARLFGFDKEAYLTALNEVPFYKEDEVEKAMDYYYELAMFIKSTAESRLQALRKNELNLYQKQLLKSLLNTVPIPVFYKDKQKHFIGCNRAFENFFSVKEDYIIGCTIDEIFGENFIAIFDDQDEKLKNERIINYEKTIPLRNSVPREVIIYKSLFYVEENLAGYIGSIIDITTTMNAFSKLEDTLQSNEMLMKEVHHRVKNNMQIISSLLNMQSHYLKDPDDKILFQSSKERIYTMALIHEKLYKSDNLARIDFKDYTLSLMDAVKRSYDISGKISLHYDLDNFDLDIDTAIPCGLILNEVVTNSYKYAFDENQKGNISIVIKEKTGKYYIEIRDDGKGFETEKSMKSSESLGIKLIDALVRQLSGSYTLHSDNGTLFKMTFENKNNTEPN